MTYAGRDEATRSAKTRYRDVPTNWGLFRIKSLTDLERSSIEEWFLNEQNEYIAERRKHTKTRWIVACVVDGEGNRLFDDSEVEAASKWDSWLTNTLLDAIWEHCGVSVDDREKLEKNSLATDAAGSEQAA